MTADQAAARKAVHQHGVISRQQARKAGLTDRQINRRLGDRRWARTGVPGVYRMAGNPVTWKQKAMAACLAAPAGTVVSHLTAAALFGLGRAPDVPHVTVPVPASGSRTGMVVHRSPLVPGERARKAGIPCTHPARMLVDCAALLTQPSLMELVDPALCQQLTTPTAVLAAAGRVSPSGRRRGLKALHEILSVWTEGIRPGSPAEMRLLRRLERWGYPAPELQVELRDGAGDFVARVDVAWSGRRAGLEYDGARHHGPRAWEADEGRQRRVEALGWRLERVEKVDLLDGAERLREVLDGLFAAQPPVAEKCW